ncbi:DUF3320 domain-containing protein [Promicromonospora iranensis]|uniref:DUF3320 domain-containing protein n=1 Tax=Promicromonospora iranensis TaxID=1105144 RepID=UPI0023A9FDEF|nr:Swt1 family HEPN domain-containing protein [Promicromonospora iranensis]
MPRESVRFGLDHLAIRLDPIIGQGLAADLNGLPWTVVLTELDRSRGKQPRDYNAKDVQCQLRMLSERLGNLGYPFDNHARLVSTLANELRIVRNAEKHYDELTTMDAWRAHDTCVRLLTHFEDVPGAEVAASFRDEAIAAVVAESGTPVSPVAHNDALGAVKVEEVLPEPIDGANVDDEYVAPSEDVLTRADGNDTPTIGTERSMFEPWVPVVVGEVGMLDNVARKVNKDRVRAVATEIAEFEGPIHIDRLITLVAASFEVPRLTTKRRQKVDRQVRQLDLYLDADLFLWPSSIDRDSWTEFRPNISTTNREFLHISPVEIANASRFIEKRSPAITSDELDVDTLRTFGRKRRTKAVATHLESARMLAES